MKECLITSTGYQDNTVLNSIYGLEKVIYKDILEKYNITGIVKFIVTLMFVIFENVNT